MYVPFNFEFPFALLPQLHFNYLYFLSLRDILDPTSTRFVSQGIHKSYRCFILWLTSVRHPSEAALPIQDMPSFKDVGLQPILKVQRMAITDGQGKHRITTLVGFKVFRCQKSQVEGIS